MDEELESLREQIRNLTDDLHGLGTSARRAREAQIDATSGIKGSGAKLTKSLDGLGQAAAQLTKDLYRGSEGAATFGNAIESVMEVIGTLVAIFLPGSKLLKLALGGLIVGVGKYAKAATEQADKLFKSYQDLSRFGAGGTGIDNLFRDMQRMGYGVDQLNEYVTVLANNSRVLAQLGGTVSKGRDAFAGLANTINKGPVGRELETMGFRLPEINEYLGSYLKLQSALGRNEVRVGKLREDAAARYIKELDTLARITGQTREQAAEQLEAAAREEAFGTRMARLQREEEAGIIKKGTTETVQRFQNYIDSVSPEMAKGVRDLISSGGVVTSEESRRVFNTIGAEGVQAIRGLTKGTETFGGALKALQPGIQRTQSSFDRLREFNAGVDEVFGKGYDNRRLLAAIQDRTAAEIDAEANLAPAIDSNTQRLADTARANRDTTASMQSFVNLGVTPATIATKALAEAANAAAKALPGSPAGGRFSRGQPPGAAPAPASRFRAPPPSTDYLSRIAQLESGGKNIPNQPRAGQTATSAFGLYQITKGTFESLVANAMPGSPLKGKTFEDMKADVNLQTEAMKQLTQSNTQLLAQRGLPTTDAAKYMAHMLGYGTAAKILEARPNASLRTVVPEDWLQKNNLQNYQTVQQLKDHFDRITGSKGYQFGGISSGPESGYFAKLHGTEAIIPLKSGHIPVIIKNVSEFGSGFAGPRQRYYSDMPGMSDFTTQYNQRLAQTTTANADVSKLDERLRNQMANMEQQLIKLDEMNGYLRKQISVSEQILQVSRV